MELSNVVEEAVGGAQSEIVVHEDTVEDLGHIAVEASEGDFAARKLPRGLKYLGDGRWRARVWHPKLMFSFWIGTYHSFEESVDAINMKRAEFREGGGDEYEGVKLPMGVRRRGYGRWQAQMTHPIFNIKLSLGCYDSPKEAAMALNRAKAEFGDTSKSKSVNVETCGSNLMNDQWDWVQESSKEVGVDVETRGSDLGDGQWDSAQKRSNEIDDEVQPGGKVVDMSKDSMVVVHHLVALKDRVTNNEKNDTIKGKESRYRVPFGVRLMKSGMWEAWATDPLTGRKQWLLSCKTFEGAVNTAMRKRAEFGESIVLKPKVVKRKCEAIDDDVKPFKCGVRHRSKCLDDCSTVNFPRAVRKIKSGKWVARTKDPESNARVWLGTYNTSDEAVTAFNKKIVEFNERTEHKSNAGLGPEAIVDLKEPECEFGYECSTSSMGSENLNSRVVNDSFNEGFFLETPHKLRNKGVYTTPTSVLNSGISDGGYSSDECQTREDTDKRLVCAPNYDEAVRLGFINEYGELLGKYRFVDELMGLSLPDEHLQSYYDTENKPSLCCNTKKLKSS